MPSQPSEDCPSCNQPNPTSYHLERCIGTRLLEIYQSIQLLRELGYPNSELELAYQRLLRRFIDFFNLDVPQEN